MIYEVTPSKHKHSQAIEQFIVFSSSWWISLCGHHKSLATVVIMSPAILREIKFQRDTC